MILFDNEHILVLRIFSPLSMVLLAMAIGIPLHIRAIPKAMISCDELVSLPC
jgi:hypothetical protein